MTGSLTQSPVSHLVRLDNVPRAGIEVEIEADEAQRAALAEEHGLLAVDRFHVLISIGHWRKNGFRLEGSIKARIVQRCVVSLEPMAVEHDIAVSTLLVPERSALDRGLRDATEELVLSFDSEDEPETFSGNRYDVGALSEELFGLELDPYPRLPGVAVDEKLALPQDEAGRQSPFSGLKDLGPKS